MLADCGGGGGGSEDIEVDPMLIVLLVLALLRDGDEFESIAGGVGGTNDLLLPVIGSDGVVSPSEEW